MQSKGMRILLGVVGVIGIVAGVMKFQKGIGELFGGGDAAKFNATIEEVKALVGPAAEKIEPALTRYQKLLDTADEKGFPGARDSYADEARAVADDCEKIAASFTSAAKLYEQAATLDVPTANKEEVRLRGQAYSSAAESLNLRRDCALMLVNPKITTIEQLLAEIKPVADKAQAAMTRAEELQGEADKVAEPASKTS